MKEKKQQSNSTQQSTVQNLSKSEAASKAGISIRKLETLIYDRKIDHVRIGRRVLIPLAALSHFIEEHTTPAYKPVSL